MGWGALMLGEGWLELVVIFGFVAMGWRGRSEKMHGTLVTAKAPMPFHTPENWAQRGRVLPKYRARVRTQSPSQRPSCHNLQSDKHQEAGGAGTPAQSKCSMTVIREGMNDWELRPRDTSNI